MGEIAQGWFSNIAKNLTIIEMNFKACLGISEEFHENAELPQENISKAH